MTETSVPAGSDIPATATTPSSPERVLKPTRTSGLWIAVIGFAILLLLLAIFLLQNGQKVQISYLGADGHIPLAVAMLLSAVAGALLVATAGMARVLQLRHTARRERKARKS
jgi:putative membrane protein